MKVKTALILCAGFGKRVQPITDSLPKPLINYKDETLLENTIKFLIKLKIILYKIRLHYIILRDVNYLLVSMVLYKNQMLVHHNQVKVLQLMVMISSSEVLHLLDHLSLYKHSKLLELVQFLLRH